MSKSLCLQSFSYDGYDDDSPNRNTFATTTESRRDFSGSNNNGNAYDNSFSQFSGQRNSRPDTYESESKSSREIINSGSSNNNGQDYYFQQTSTSRNINPARDIYNQQPRETSTSRLVFIADSLSGSESNSGNSNNFNSVPQRPFTQRTSTTSNYNFENRRTTTSSTYRPDLDITTKKSSYFQGDLPFFNSDSDETSVNSN